jgi:hypothetical protein
VNCSDTHNTLVQIPVIEVYEITALSNNIRKTVKSLDEGLKGLSHEIELQNKGLRQRAARGEGGSCQHREREREGGRERESNPVTKGKIIKFVQYCGRGLECDENMIIVHRNFY